MKIVGIIAEYNPFHNGHIYHIKQIKTKYPDSLIILVLNGYFLERGEISIQTKEDKALIALQSGIDIVLELPVIFGTQSADVFANAAIKILNEFKVDKIIFGSEINDIKIIKTIAQNQLEPHFDNKVKEYINLGFNYPTSVSKALNINFNYTPNDLLGISYAKVILKNSYNIDLESIKRTNDYHDNDLDNNIVSASNIRKKISENYNIKKYMPIYSFDKINNIDFHVLFALIKYQIIVCQDLNQYLDVVEGIDFLLKEKISFATNLNGLIDLIKSKRYTYNRLNRMLIHILLNIQKDIDLKDLKYINVLGFNDKGKKYLNGIKKNIKIPIKKDFDSIQYKTEMKASLIYDLISQKNTIDFEKNNKPIYYKK